MDNKAIGLFLIGITIGMIFPDLPEPAAQFSTYLPFVFIILGIIVMIKG